MKTQYTNIAGARLRQRGMSLLFALMGLVALSLAAVALVRSVDTGTSVLGNLGFKQDATVAADRASEYAISWIAARVSGTTLNNDIAGSGYYATSLDGLDPTGTQVTGGTRVVVDWDSNNCANAGAFTSCLAPATDPASAGTRRYVITRLCSAAGSPTGGATSCVLPINGSAGSNTNHNDVDYNRRPFTNTVGGSPYYRIVVRTAGARGTRSYTDTIIHF